MDTENNSEGDFNPRAYVRHDSLACRRVARRNYFNPRAYVRHDRWGGILATTPGTFQSTCLREARPLLGMPSSTGAYFNPRAYVRHDARPDPTLDDGGISIHVPT